VTAVTTAGLLAGLFGSAFVPAAHAADEDANIDAITLTSSDNDVDSITGTTIYALAGKALALNVSGGTTATDADDDLADAGTLSVTTVGTTIISVVPDATNNAAAQTNLILTSTFKSASGYLTALAKTNPGVDGNVTMAVANVYAGAAGTTVTITVTFAGQDAGEETATYSIVAVGAKSTGIPAASQSTFDSACAFTVGTEQAAGGSLCSVSKITYFDVDTEFGIGFDIEDGYGDDVTAGYVVSATATGALGGLEFSNDADCNTEDDSSSATASAVPTAGGDTLCFNSDGATLGTGTITLSVGNITKTYKFGIIGTLASLKLSAPAYIPAVANGDTLRDAWGDAFVLEGTDAKGTVLGDGGGLAADVTEDDDDAGDGDGTGYSDGDIKMTAADFKVLDENGADMGVTTSEGDEDDAADDLSLGALEFADDLVKYIDADDATDNYAVSEMNNNAYNVPVDLCGEDEEGLTRKVSATSGTVTSNTVTVTCVSDDVKIISMTALATGTSGSATSGKNGQTIKVEVVAQDGMGNPAGAGASFTFTVQMSDAATTAGGAISSFTAGKATLTITLGSASGSQYVIYSATDSNSYTTAKEAFAQKVSYTVTNDADALTALSISTGRKGRVVTASGFNAGELVKFEVENALTGVVRTYNRKANASGVAKWRNATAALKYVTAIDSDDNLTDTISVKRK
jgi:hypothetical protein